MVNTINDPVFGEMEVKHGWHKNMDIGFWGKTVNLRIKATQYSNTEIIDIQRKNYQFVIDNMLKISEMTKKAIVDYINKNSEEIESVLSDKFSYDPEKNVFLNTIIFFADGTYGLLFDCTWDVEHGLVVKLPEYEVGPQDILL